MIRMDSGERNGKKTFKSDEEEQWSGVGRKAKVFLAFKKFSIYCPCGPSQKPFFSNLTSLFQFLFYMIQFRIKFLWIFLLFLLRSHAGDMFAIVRSCYEQRKVEISSHSSGLLSFYIAKTEKKNVRTGKKTGNIPPEPSPHHVPSLFSVS